MLLSKRLLKPPSGAPALPEARFIAVGTNTNKYVRAWNWSNAGGFGSEVSAPSLATVRRPYGITFNSDSSAIFLAGTSTGDKLVGLDFSASGFGTRWTAPASLPTYSVYEALLHPDENAIVISNWTASPYSHGWAISGGAFGSKYSSPAGVPSVFARRAAMAPSGAAIVVATTAGDTADVVYGYPFSPSSGFGTKYSALTQYPSASTYMPVFSRDGNYVVVSINGGLGGLYGWEWDDSSGFGTAISAPSSSPGTCAMLDFSPDGSVLVVGLNQSPWIAAYEWDNGFGARYDDYGASLGASPADIKFSPCGKFIAVTTPGQGTRLTVIEWDNSTGFGSAVSGVPDLVTGSDLAYGVGWGV